MKLNKLKKQLTAVTPVSKLIAGIIFIISPFLGFYLGVRYQKYSDMLTILELRKQISINAKDVDELNKNYLRILQPKAVETYTSKNLGISFSYAPGNNPKHPIKIKEIDDKIYIYVNYSKTEPDDPTKGRFIQVFSKDPNKSLEDTIRSSYLQGYPQDICIISEINQNSSYSKYNPHNEYYIIDIPRQPTDNYKELESKALMCPKTYTHWRRVNYFVMDKNHPDKYAFVEVGQDTMGAYPNTTYDMTIRFND